VFINVLTPAHNELQDMQRDLNCRYANLAVVELNNFIFHINIGINIGVLSSTNGQTMIDAANNIINV
jgi:hypothetical protein